MAKTMASSKSEKQEGNKTKTKTYLLCEEYEL